MNDDAIGVRKMDPPDDTVLYQSVKYVFSCNECECYKPSILASGSRLCSGIDLHTMGYSASRETMRMRERIKNLHKDIQDYLPE